MSEDSGAAAAAADPAKALAALESRHAALIARHDNTENELAFVKKRLDAQLQKAQQEKEDEIAQLKQAFAEVSEKRKEAFTQLKEKLQQASVVVNRYAASQAELESAVASSRSQLEATQRQLSERESELAALRSSTGQAEASAGSRVQALEAELAGLRASSSAASSSASELETELANARARIESLEERVKGRPSAKCSIAVEDAGGGKEAADTAPLFPSVLENGRTVKFSWSLSGTVRIQWFRSFRGSAWEPIPGKTATKPSYTLSVDDIGACLRAEATHTVTAASVFAEAGPVHPSTAMLQTLAEPLRKLDFSFAVESANAGSDAERQRRLLLNKEKIKLQDAKGKTVAKKEWGEHVKAVLDGDSERRFSVQIEQNGPIVSYVAPNQRARDLIVVCLRAFVYVITRHGGRLDNKLEHLMALSLHVRTLNETAQAPRLSTVPSSRRTGSVGGSGGGSTPGKPPVAGGAAGGGAGGGGGKPVTPASNRKADGSGPSTPVSHSAGAPAQPGNGRRVSGAGEDDWGGFGLPPPAQSAAQAGSGGSSSAAASNGQQRATRRNAEGEELDDEGFIVTKNRGFDDIAPKGGDDSDPEEDAEQKAPAIKVQINAEARAPASADTLKNMSSGLSLTAPKKKGKKGDKKGKKGKKEEGGGELQPAGGAAAGGGSLNGGAADGGAALFSDNAVPGLPPLLPSAQSSAADASDPFADFFKPSQSSKAAPMPAL